MSGLSESAGETAKKMSMLILSDGTQETVLQRDREGAHSILQETKQIRAFRKSQESMNDYVGMYFYVPT